MSMDSLDSPVAVVKETYLSRRPTPGSARVAVSSVAVLIVASIAYWADAAGLASSLPASRASVLGRGELWRLVTTLAIHADVQHLLSNGLLFGALSFLLYGYFGASVYPAMSLAAGILVTWFALASYPPHVQLVGASGVVYLMAGFWLSQYLFIERRLPPGKRWLRAAGFSLILLVPTVFEPNVSYRTHVLGFVVGAGCGALYFQRNKERFRRAERTEWE